MNAVHNILPQPDPSRVATHFDTRVANALWVTLSPEGQGRPPYFSPELLHELMALLKRLRAQRVNWSSNGALQPVHYTVMRSAHPEYFSVGGDLAHFHDCIVRRDQAALRDYSMQCAEMLCEWSSLLGSRATNIALVQGRALGGGFETVLAADYIVAEQHSEFGFPEILFGLFPCSGGMSLLAQRIGARAAERMLGDSRIWSASALKDMGVIDEVCPTGQGELAVERFIAAHSRHRKAHLMLQRSRQRHAALSLEELRTVVEEWTETAMSLPPQDLRVMEMLLKMQRSRVPG